IRGLTSIAIARTVSTACAVAAFVTLIVAAPAWVHADDPPPFALTTFPLDPPEPPIATSEYTPLVPARLLDTRPVASTIDGGGLPAAPLGANGMLDLTVVGRGGVPDEGVSAVVLNITVTEPTAPSFVTVWPKGAERPNASNLNFVPGQTRPNAAIAKVGSD